MALADSGWDSWWMLVSSRSTCMSMNGETETPNVSLALSQSDQKPCQSLSSCTSSISLNILKMSPLIATLCIQNWCRSDCSCGTGLALEARCRSVMLQLRWCCQRHQKRASFWCWWTPPWWHHELVDSSLASGAALGALALHSLCWQTPAVLGWIPVSCPSSPACFNSAAVVWQLLVLILRAGGDCLSLASWLMPC